VIGGEVQVRLRGQVLRLSPARRVATVALKGVGGGRSYAGAYAGGTGELAPVADGSPVRPGMGRYLGRLVKVDPTERGAELDLVIKDDEAWQALAAGSARVEALVAFEGSSGGDPVGGRPVRIEIF
jgi:hypothetical protein